MTLKEFIQEKNWQTHRFNRWVKTCAEEDNKALDKMPQEEWEKLFGIYLKDVDAPMMAEIEADLKEKKDGGNKS